MTKDARLTAVCDKYADRIDAAKTKFPARIRRRPIGITSNS
jgi:hypothetical protein